MNIKQKCVEKSQAKNPLFSDQHITKCDKKKSRLVQSNEYLEQQRTKTGTAGQEETEEFVGVTATPGNTKLPARFRLQTQAKITTRPCRKLNIDKN
jgi:hypothetical protein